MNKVFVKNSTEQTLIEVYESFNGDLYFVTEKFDDANFGYVRLYSMPDCAEWGGFRHVRTIGGSIW